MTQPLIILGIGGNAYDVLDIVDAINDVSPTWDIVGYLDDARPVGSEHAGHKVLGKLSDAARFPGHKFINSIGNDRTFLRRKEIVDSTGLPIEAFVTLIHPTATISRRATVGRGVFICAGCAVAGSVVLGDHVSLLSGAIIGHDTILGPYTIAAPGACISGLVRVGEGCYLGARAVIRQQLSVGNGALIGMGACVTRDVSAGAVQIGNPARRVIRTDSARAANPALPRVDVIVPCYRYAHYLRLCVQSVLTQPGVDVRVLILDDASPDDTETVERAIAGEDSRVEFRRHAINSGHIATFNEGIDWATGRYLLLLSADDLLTPGALERATKLMDEHPDVGMTYGREIKLRSGVPVAPAVSPEKYSSSVMTGLQYLQEVCATGENFVPTPSVVVRTSIQKRIGGYRRELTHAGDFEMWMRFATQASVGFIDADQAYYRLHGDNMSTQYPGLMDYEQRRASFDAVFDTWGHVIPGATALRATADRNLARGAFWTASQLFDTGEVGLCKKYLAWAAEVDPSIRRTAMWMRFHCKRMVGPAAWMALRPMVYRLRGREIRGTAGKGVGAL